MTLDREMILSELKRGGVLNLGQILRLRVRHMTDGVALGSRAFVNEVFLRHRHKFGADEGTGRVESAGFQCQTFACCGIYD